jgi:hypothetical protein
MIVGGKFGGTREPKGTKGAMLILPVEAAQLEKNDFYGGTLTCFDQVFYNPNLNITVR